jgi:hypothetical protein
MKQAHEHQCMKLKRRKGENSESSAYRSRHPWSKTMTLYSKPNRNKWTSVTSNRFSLWTVDLIADNGDPDGKNVQTGLANRVDRGCFIPKQTGRLTVCRNITQTQTWVVQWLRLALSNGPNRIGVSPHLRTEIDPVSETSYFDLLIL